MTILDQIVAHKKEELASITKKRSLVDLKSMVEENSSPFDFFKSLNEKKPVSVIAECKKMSPSKGIICEDYDPVKQAISYQRGGAAAISVLTDERYFGGHSSHLRDVADNVSIPAMRKDFIIDEYQIWEARFLGASSFLLIAGVLDTAQVQYFLEIGRDLGMEALVESYSESDLDIALKTDARIIGVNNRNLGTMEVNFNHILSLRNKILSSRDPGDCIIVCESGVSSLEDVHTMTDNGIDTFLIGEFLMRSDSPEEILRSLTTCD